MREIVIKQANAGQKALKFVKSYLKDAPLGFIYKLFRKKDVKVNNHWVKEDFLLKENDVVRIYVTDEQLEDFLRPKSAIKKDLPYPIIYEDKNILLINKPAGVMVTSDGNENNLTLAQEVINYLYFKGEYSPEEGGFTPAPAHRLDRNTSGLILFGKNDASLKCLTLAFKNHENICKTYLSLVKGNVFNKGKIDKPLKKEANRSLVHVASIREGGKEALTLYEPKENYEEGYSLLSINLLTGRTHQIRVHLASISHPVVGDRKYGDFATNKIFKERFGLNYQLLHAYSISFDSLMEPLSYLSNKTFIAPLSPQFTKILSSLKKVS